MKIYYGDDPLNVVRQNNLDLLTLEVDGITREPLTLKEELILVAEQYAQDVPDLHVALSGGWDSNVCLHTFVEAGIKPNVVIFKFPENLNAFDVDPALITCKKYGIDPRVIEIEEFMPFLKTHLIPTATKYQTYTFFQTLVAYYLEQEKINCLIVDKVDLRRDCNPNMQWSFIRGEISNWPARFNLLNDNKVYMDFFSKTPEAMLAYLKLPVVEQVVSASRSGKISLQSLKHKLFKEGGFSIPLYTRTISTDKVIALNNACDEAIVKNIGLRARACYVEYPRIINALENKGDKKWQYIL